MSLIVLADHTEKSGANLLNHATSANMTCGSGVTGGGANGTLHDTGTSADEIIDSGVSTDASAFWGVSWFRMNGTIASGFPYMCLIAKGAIGADNTRFNIGIRTNGSGNGCIGYMYGKSGGSLRGTEGGAGFPALALDTIYRWAWKWDASGGTVYVNETSTLTTGDAIGSDGGQDITLAGPDAFLHGDDKTAAVELLYSIVGTGAIDEGDLLTYSDDPTLLFASGGFQAAWARGSNQLIQPAA